MIECEFKSDYTNQAIKKGWLHSFVHMGNECYAMVLTPGRDGDLRVARVRYTDLIVRRPRIPLFDSPSQAGGAARDLPDGA